MEERKELPISLLYFFFVLFCFKTVLYSPGRLWTMKFKMTEVFIFWYKISLCSPGCPRSCSVDKAGLKLRSASLCLPGLGIKACVTMYNLDDGTPASNFQVLGLEMCVTCLAPKCWIRGVCNLPSSQVLGLQVCATYLAGLLVTRILFIRQAPLCSYGWPWMRDLHGSLTCSVGTEGMSHCTHLLFSGLYILFLIL